MNETVSGVIFYFSDSWLYIRALTMAHAVLSSGKNWGSTEGEARR